LIQNVGQSADRGEAVSSERKPGLVSFPPVTIVEFFGPQQVIFSPEGLQFGLQFAFGRCRSLACGHMP